MALIFTNEGPDEPLLCSNQELVKISVHTFFRGSVTNQAGSLFEVCRFSTATRTEHRRIEIENRE